MNFKEFLSRPISGEELLFLFERTNYPASLFGTRIVLGADNAIKQIETQLGVRPSSSGANVADIQHIRDLLYEISGSIEQLNGLTITAPHTHWNEKTPVIYSYLPEKKAYLVGPQVIMKTVRYVPVSFVFSKDLPLCYEWIDETIALKSEEWESAYDVINKLNNSLDIEKSLFGIAIDFRFRPTLKEEPVSSLELPIDFSQDGVGKNFSYIVNQSADSERTDSSLTDQVAWHPFSEKCFDFSPVELAVLDNVRAQLTAAKNVQERELILKELQEDFSRLSR